MINALLISLTNKTTGYANSYLNIRQPFKTDGAYEEVRRILTNESDDTAIYLAQAVHYDPYAAMYLSDGQQSYTTAGIVPAQGAVTGAKLVGNATGPAVVSGADVPLNSVLEVTYNSPTSVRLSVTGRIALVSVSVSPDGMHLAIAWPEWSGISGDVVLEGAYGPSTAFSVMLGGKYLYEDTCTLLEASDAFFELLIKTDMEEAYYSAVSPNQKVAVAVLALYRHFISIQ